MTNIKTHPYIEAILLHLKNKYIEISCGDVNRVRKMDEFDVNVRNILVGKLIDGVGDCIIIEVDHKDISQPKTKVFVNVWGIKLIVPYDSPLFIKDIFIDDFEGFAQ